MLSMKADERGISFAVIDGDIGNTKIKNEIVQNFQKGLYKVLFIHPQSGAHGLTLTAATRTIWASPTYNLEHYHQGIKRIHRAGQRDITETIVVVAENTVDTDVFAKCKSKQVRMNDLLQLLKDSVK
jgi:SNF2 family DNA or RNA helicase